MAIALESFGFNWAANCFTAPRDRASGFLADQPALFSMTLFLNNDGSVLITTPILLLVLQYLGLKRHQKTPYLISGVLIATAASTPIGVSNIVNLISLKMIGMDLYLYTNMMFIPGTLGLVFILSAVCRFTAVCRNSSPIFRFILIRWNTNDITRFSLRQTRPKTAVRTSCFVFWHLYCSSGSVCLQLLTTAYPFRSWLSSVQSSCLAGDGFI